MGWLPDWKWKQQQAQKKGGGKGWQKKSSVNPKTTLWIGNIADGVTFKDLKAHCDQAGNCKWAEVYKNKGKGTGAVGYASADEAASAVPMLNGSLLNGMSLQV